MDIQQLEMIQHGGGCLLLNYQVHHVFGLKDLDFDKFECRCTPFLHVPLKMHSKSSSDLDFLRRASVIAHHPTPKLVLRSVIFSTPKNLLKSYTIRYKMSTHSTCIYILRNVFCSAAGIFKRQGLVLYCLKGHWTRFRSFLFG